MNWLKRAYQHRRLAQVPSAQEVITGVIQGSWTLPNAIDALRRMVSQDHSVCEMIQAQLSASSGVPQQTARSIQMLSDAVCGDLQSQMEQQIAKQMQMSNPDLPSPVENVDVPESEEFR